MSVFHGSEIISFLGPKIGCHVPLELNELTSVDVFKKHIKACKDMFSINDDSSRKITEVASVHLC